MERVGATGILLVGFAHLSPQRLDVEASGQARDRNGIRRGGNCMLITSRHFGDGSDFLRLQACKPMEFITMASSDSFGLQAYKPMECTPSTIHISTRLSHVGIRVGALRYPRLSSYWISIKGATIEYSTAQHAHLHNASPARPPPHALELDLGA